MTHFLTHPEIFNLIFLLEKEEELNPIEFIKRFTGEATLNEYRHYIFQVKEVLLTSDNDIFDESSERASVNMLLANLEKLIEFAFIISRNQKLSLLLSEFRKRPVKS